MESSPLRTAVVGYGLAGRAFHTPLIHHSPGFSLDLIVTGNPERAANATARYPDATIVPAFDDVLSRAAELDVVVIATPPELHHPQAKAALEAGLDVVVDKPFTVTSTQGEELVALAARLGRRLTVYQNRRWDNALLTVRRLLEDGTLGEVHRFNANMERWSPGFSKQWKASSGVERGGGLVFDLGTHLVDCALQLFGPARVLHAEIAARRPGEPADDDAFLVLEHARDGAGRPVLSHLSMTLTAAQPGPVFDVRGSGGSYVKFGFDPQEAQLSAGLTPADPGYGVEADEASGILSDGTSNHVVRSEPGRYQEFYRLLELHLRGEGPAPVDPAGETGPLAGLRLIEEARRIAR
ncbi:MULTISPECIES: Gfo/Idh/MocA family oxidoreductase [Arthrobacter]|uniref:Gfo/Idh/MocA family oxidoreductase n=2 Tax=Arthrobacter TaxID=1663 RepID=A0ABU9KKS0_9MICC|nr:Gfo/Idh/MocA family oxidoreductase [Arthrobacter sp. YJM1]MDP5226808.1 Gfo/Idh/MocA family oxidoreductase [Arthrobacter sp. YJM1]